eukprot:3055407-Rhodomonas_salina.2
MQENEQVLQLLDKKGSGEADEDSDEMDSDVLMKKWMAMQAHVNEVPFLVRFLSHRAEGGREVSPDCCGMLGSSAGGCVDPCCDRGSEARLSWLLVIVQGFRSRVRVSGVGGVRSVGVQV